ncbi:MAG: DUF4198 domain-containing protein [Fuerstiella sp.]|nr:DUF4198 domain-containing protein [Fuerstiella sp.]
MTKEFQMKPYQISLTALLMAMFLSSTANAHFPWLVIGNDPGRVQIYVSESAAPDKPEFLKNLVGVPVQQITAAGDTKELSTAVGETSLIATPLGNTASAFVLAGAGRVLPFHGKNTLMNSCGKTYCPSANGKWNTIDSSNHVELDIVPRVDGDKLTLQVLWHGKPAVDAELSLKGPIFSNEVIAGQVSRVTAELNDKGEFSFTLPKSGLLSIRASYTEQTKGELDGKEYVRVRNNSTLALNLSN